MLINFKNLKEDINKRSNKSPSYNKNTDNIRDKPKIKPIILRLR